MRMPQEFVDAINEAVKAINPDAMTMVSGSMTLGSDFDEFLGPKALMKYGLEPIPQEDQARFESLWEEKKETLKAELVRSAVDTEKKLMAGYDFAAAGRAFLDEDKRRCEEQWEKNKTSGLFGRAPSTHKPARNLNEVIDALERGDYEEVDPMTADEVDGKIT